MTTSLPQRQVPQLRAHARCQLIGKPFDMIFGNWGRDPDTGLPQWWLQCAETIEAAPPTAGRSSGGNWLARLVAACKPPEPPAPPVQGLFYIGPDYAGCPFCQAREFFRCGREKCRQLACWDQPSGPYIICPSCGAGGAVKGGLGSLAGDLEIERPRLRLAAPARWLLIEQ